MTTGTIVIRPLTASLTRDTDFFSRMDPYVKVTMGTRVQKSAVAKKAGKNPSWSDEITFRYSGEDLIKIEIWDKDRNSKDDLVASTSMSISHLKTKGNKMNEWISLSYKGKSAGRLMVDIQFFPDAEIKKDLTKNATNNTTKHINNTWNPVPGFAPTAEMMQPKTAPMVQQTQMPMYQQNQAPGIQHHIQPQQFGQPMHQPVNNTHQPHNTHNNPCNPAPSFAPTANMMQPNIVPMTQQQNQMPMYQPNQTPGIQQHYFQPQQQMMPPQQSGQAPMYQPVNNVHQQPQMYAQPICMPQQQQMTHPHLPKH